MRIFFVRVLKMQWFLKINQFIEVHIRHHRQYENDARGIKSDFQIDNVGNYHPHYLQL